MMNIPLSLLFIFCMNHVSSDPANHREARRIMNYIKPPSEYSSGTKYKLCEVGETQGACMSNAKCDNMGGRFIGYCKGEDVCCHVRKTCGDTTSSHSSLFENPSFPSNDSDYKLCPYTVKINRDICAVRVDFKVLELSHYEDGLCIRDTLTILGSKGKIATPVCGNMTNYATTFEVEEFSEVVLAAVLQGVPPHRFSIEVTQLPCREILQFQSPTYSGIRNDDAIRYTTTTTTTTAPPPTTQPEESSSEEETSGEENGDENSTDEVETTTFMIPVRSAGGDIMEDSEEEAEKEEVKPTTLRTGEIKIVEKPNIIIKSGNLDTEDFVEEPQRTGKDGVYLGTISRVPTISAFSRAYTSQLNSTTDCGFDIQPDIEDISQENPIGQFRVIGGGYTNLNEYPWQVALVYNNKFFCGGSLISDRHILTAAHCIFGSFSGGVEKLRVSLGDMDLTTKNETSNIVGKVKKVFWHLNYSPHTTSNDIGIFELEQPVNFTYGISAVKLPTDLSDDFENLDATVTGWGRYSASKKATSTILKAYTGPLTPIDECVESWSKFPGISAKKDMHICLGVKMGTPCHGDSGGPLVVCNGPQCTQVGVVSFGFPLCTNVGLPAVFTRVSSYKRWIDISLSPLHYN